MNQAANIPTSIDVRQPDETSLIAQADGFLGAAKSIVVSDQQTMDTAAKYLTDNKAEQKRLENERRELVDPLNDVVKNINAKFKPIMDTLKQAETIVKRAISDFQTKEQRRIAQERAEAEAKARKERERLEARAEKAAEKGDTEKAEELSNQAVSTVAAIPVSEPVKAAGVSTRRTWKAEVTDPVAVCRLIADGQLPPTMVDFKQAELNKVASTWQDNRAFDGLRIYPELQVASR